MTSVLIGFLFVSLFLYVIFGGADFGAGVVEFSFGKDISDKHRKVINRAIAPVWEANHIWLILAIVILMMGFPRIYTDITHYLFVPLMGFLVGMVARGCAFAFRYYDPTPNALTIERYSQVFALSSIWCSAFLGILVGALSYGGLRSGHETVWNSYFAPWVSLHLALCGLFACLLFGFLASIYLLGEVEEASLLAAFRRKAYLFAGLMVITGFLVFLTGWWEQSLWVEDFWTSRRSLMSFGIATVWLIPLGLSLKHPKQRLHSRVYAVGLVLLILLGWVEATYPIAIEYHQEPLTYYEAAAPMAVQQALLAVLFAGTLLVLPALGYLFYVFKKSS